MLVTWMVVAYVVQRTQLSETTEWCALCVLEPGDVLNTLHVSQFIFNNHIEVAIIINFREEETEARKFNSLAKDHQLLSIGTRF